MNAGAYAQGPKTGGSGLVVVRYLKTAVA
jgi:hypothetical protein